MVRVLRYPRMFYFILILTIAAALLRDACVSAAVPGWPQVLLVITLLLLMLCVAVLVSQSYNPFIYFRF